MKRSLKRIGAALLLIALFAYVGALGRMTFGPEAGLLLQVFLGIAAIRLLWVDSK